MKTFDDFIEWLEMQPLDREFINTSGRMCVGHRFMVESGVSKAKFHTLGDIKFQSELLYQFITGKLGCENLPAGETLEMARRFKSQQL